MDKFTPSIFKRRAIPSTSASTNSSEGQSRAVNQIDGKRHKVDFRSKSGYESREGDVHYFSNELPLSCRIIQPAALEAVRTAVLNTVAHPTSAETFAYHWFCPEEDLAMVGNVISLFKDLLGCCLAGFILCSFVEREDPFDKIAITYASLMFGCFFVYWMMSSFSCTFSIGVLPAVIEKQREIRQASSTGASRNVFNDRRWMGDTIDLSAFGVPIWATSRQMREIVVSCISFAAGMIQMFAHLRALGQFYGASAVGIRLENKFRAFNSAIPKLFEYSKIRLMKEFFDDYKVSIDGVIVRCRIAGVSALGIMVSAMRGYEKLRQQRRHSTHLVALSEAIKARRGPVVDKVAAEKFGLLLNILRGLKKYHADRRWFSVSELIAEGALGIFYFCQFASTLYHWPFYMDVDRSESSPIEMMLRRIGNGFIGGMLLTAGNNIARFIYSQKTDRIIKGYQATLLAKSEAEVATHPVYRQLKNDSCHKILFETGDYPLCFHQVQKVAFAEFIENNPPAACRALLELLRKEYSEYIPHEGDPGPVWEVLKILGIDDQNLTRMQIGGIKDASLLLGMLLGVIEPLC